MSKRLVIRGSLAGLAALALTGGLLTVGVGAGSAAEDAPPGPGRIVAVAPPDTPDVSALGIIVQRSGSRAALKGVTATVETALPGVTVANTAGLMAGMDVVNFDAPVSGATARRVAARVAAQPGVEWAEPNYLRFPLEDEPVFPTDPLWAEQWDMWDEDAVDGGYGVKAPYAWATTTGLPEVIVAVLDTGITRHPDLNDNVVPGYDFVSNPLQGNDNDPRGARNSRDANPADPGDWITRKESRRGPYRGCRPSNSSWHGTHVAGTIAAIADNGVGISGVAPDVLIQPVRVLGKCGGTTADTVAAITWASGGRVRGVPANATPADVINMSLGGPGQCARAEQRAIDGALSRGVSVVVAAGNSAAPLATFSPASCTGVVRVGSTTRSGELSNFSNYGVSGFPMTVSAPGSEILSTYNSGRKRPRDPAFATQSGTSMAAPHVAGAAALLYSDGVTTPSEVTTRLQAAIQPFPGNCPEVNCGSGILDLSRLFSSGPTPPPPPPPPPSTIGAPTDVTWFYSGAGSIDVFFTPPSIPSGTAIDVYLVQGSLSAVTWENLGTFPGWWSDFGVNGIGSGVNYYYRFAAVLTDGRQGEWSTVIGPVRF